MKRIAAATAGVLAVLCMAPTPGDIGGCGATVREMNVETFAFERKTLDCQRCNDCGLRTARCSRACDPKASPDTALPATCRPLVHDGEVCIDALKAASCSDYASYVADTNATTPSECDFCRMASTTPLEGFDVDAGPSEKLDAEAE